MCNYGWLIAKIGLHMHSVHPDIRPTQQAHQLGLKQAHMLGFPRGDFCAPWFAGEQVLIVELLAATPIFLQKRAKIIKIRK